MSIKINLRAQIILSSIRHRKSPADSRKPLHPIVRAAALTAISTCFFALPSLALSESGWAQLQRSATDALDANKYWLAEPLLKQSVAEAEKFGFNDIRLAKSLSELGRLYVIRGRFSEAEPYLERELAVREMVLGRDDGKLVDAMGSLIKFYLAYGTKAKADPLTEEVLAFVEGKMREPLSKPEQKTALKKDAPLEGWAGSAAPAMRDPILEWSITCDSVGNAYRGLGKYEMAERLYKASLDIKSTILGKGHLSLANSYDNLGTLCLSKNENAEAESYFRDAYLTTERTLPQESPEVYARLDKLAKCLIKEGKYSQAEELYQKALHFWDQVPSKTGDESRANFALGSLYCEEKKFALAAPYLKRALNMVERFSGPCQIGLVPYLEKYAYALYYLGRREETRQLRARADYISGGT
ncbi:MAG: tetratricopeptide repeat-containing protein [Candidatus Obscuribacterales bacterium]|nr:tetratricopeptide repeat-containing protein [Candidatus Obscuribacterales bacterium]